jgi:hypothetical protein
MFIIFHTFFTENISEKLRLLFHFQGKKFETGQKVLENFLNFSLAFSVKKSVENNGHFSPVSSLKNLKCSTSVI